MGLTMFLSCAQRNAEKWWPGWVGKLGGKLKDERLAVVPYPPPPPPPNAAIDPERCNHQWATISWAPGRMPMCLLACLLCLACTAYVAGSARPLKVTSGQSKAKQADGNVVRWF